MGQIHWHENKIDIFGNPEPKDIRNVSQGLHILISKKGYLDIELDFSRSEALFPSFMLPLIALCRARRKEGRVDFDIIFPEKDSLRSLFHNTNWSHLINDQKYKETTYDGDIHVPAMLFHDSCELGQAVKRVIGTLIGQLDGIDGKALGALEWSINEITDNVLSHSESRSGGIIQATVMTQNHEVEFVVSDAGIGISKSLGIKDNEEALIKCIQEGITRDKKSNQGNGLFGSFQIATVSGGTFSIISGKGVLSAKGIGDVSTDGGDSSGSSFFPGTSVSARINCIDPKLISTALKFEGKVHDPEFGYIDSHFGSESGDHNFKLISEVSSFGSRDCGRIVFRKISVILEGCASNKLIVDFEGIRIISSSFADEVFGKLFIKIGPVRFVNQLKFKNIDAIIEGLINRAITQRVASSCA